MANIFYTNDNATDTLYAVILRDSDGYWWNTAGSPAFEAYNAANYADYVITISKIGSTVVYSGTFPAAIAAGVYNILILKQAAGSPAVGDGGEGAGTFAWDGTTLRDDSDIGAISRDATAADNLETACDGGSYNLGGSGIVSAGDTPGTTELLTRIPDATPGESGGIQLVGTKYPVTLLAEDVSGNIAADIKVISSGAIDQTVINNLFSNFALIEDYAATGVNATPTQILYMIMQSLHEFGISGVKRTVYKLDGETTAAEFTLDSDTAPTITTRTL